LYVTSFGINHLLPIFLFLYCFFIISIFAFKIKVPEGQISSSLHLKDKDIAKDTDNAKNKDSSKYNNDDLNISEHSNKNPEEKTIAAPSGYVQFFIKYKDFSILLIGIAMLFYSHNIISTYLINIVENVGGNSTNMGISLAITASVELPIMAAFTYIVRKVRCNVLIKISAFFFFVKVLILWLAPSVYVVYLSQAMQMFAYGLFTPASVYYVNSIVNEQDKVKGQSMLGVAMSIAGAVAIISGGKLLDIIGVNYMLLLGAIVTAFGFIIVCISTKNVDHSFS
jgi:PPP family 3-phenylpropionic acid transporter